VRLVRILPERLRGLAPETLTFGAIGLLNTVLFLAVVNVTLTVGVVKATVIATVVTTTVSYLMNRHWTYKDRPRGTLRREYTLFFAFNLAGMVIQSGVVGFGKYGLGLREEDHRLALNIATVVGILLATIFRFWAYRTLVFKSEPTLAVVEIPADQAARAGSTAPAPRQSSSAGTNPGGPAGSAGSATPGRPGSDEFTELTAGLEAEMADQPADELSHGFTAGSAVRE
jgi:putative flippase GtrA